MRLFERKVLFMIKVTLTNDILKKISSIDENRFSLIKHDRVTADDKEQAAQEF